MTLIQALLTGGGAIILAILGYLKIRGDRAVKAKDVAEAREVAAAGKLKRDKGARTAGDVISQKTDEERRAREAIDVRLEAEKASASKAWDVERQRTADAASRGSDALVERANQAIREGKVPKGKPQ